MSRSRVPVTTDTRQASAAITADRLVKLAAGNLVTQAALNTDRCYGVAMTQATAAGQDVPVQTLGVAIVEAGAAITEGDDLMSDTSGRAITKTSTNPVFGQALEAASGAGVKIRAFLVQR